MHVITVASMERGAHGRLKNNNKSLLRLLKVDQMTFGYKKVKK